MNRRALFALAPTAVVSAAVASLAAPARASGGGGDGEAKVSDNPYIRFPTVTATILRPDGRRGVMSVETGVDVADEILRLRATQDAPRLRAAYNGVVQTFAAGLLPGAVPDVDRLSRELQAATTRILARRGATLLLGTVMVV